MESDFLELSELITHLFVCLFSFKNIRVPYIAESNRRSKLLKYEATKGSKEEFKKVITKNLETDKNENTNYQNSGYTENAILRR